MNHFMADATKFPRTDCSTIIVGKNVSTTGRVLLAHNEDDPNCVVQSHLVPRMQHAEGETIRFADGTAVIPQVPETCAYYWTELRSLAGEAFADGYLNEHGVALVSNGCVDSNHAEGVTGGMGYALRNLIAQRAHSAREGVEIAAALVEEFGYYSTRSYAICDKDEGWIFQVTIGHNFVARRVEDDEILYIPNWLTIHEVDFSDTEHKKFYFSKTLLSDALENGWYKPAKEGDYSDFDFAKAYQAGSHEIPSNMWRSDLAWRQITGAEPMPWRTFSIKAPRKYGIEDLKKILRSHYDGHEEDLKEDPKMSPHRYGICRDNTMDSMVVEFADIPELTCAWRASLRPCTVPYTPWYAGITAIPDGYEILGAKSSMASHFAVDPAEFKFDGNRPYSAFHMIANLMEFDYQGCAKRIHSDIEKMEALMTATKPMIDEAYLKLVETNPEAACQLLTDYTAAQAQKSWKWALQVTQDLMDERLDAYMMDWRSKL